MNNGKVIDMIDVLKNKAKCAKDFSEGNIVLEKLLLFCFNNNIETTSCCTGHNVNPAFIIFKVQKDNFKIYATLFRKIKNNKNIFIEVGGIFSEYINMTIMNNKNINANDFFDSIYNILYNIKRKTTSKLFDLMIKLVNNYMTASDIIGISYKKRDNIEIAVATNSKNKKDFLYREHLKQLLLNHEYKGNNNDYFWAKKKYIYEKDIIEDLQDIIKSIIENKKDK